MNQLASSAAHEVFGFTDLRQVTADNIAPESNLPWSSGSQLAEIGKREGVAAVLRVAILFYREGDEISLSEMTLNIDFIDVNDPERKHWRLARRWKSESKGQDLIRLVTQNLSKDFRQVKEIFDAHGASRSSSGPLVNIIAPAPNGVTNRPFASVAFVVGDDRGIENITLINKTLNTTKPFQGTDFSESSDNPTYINAKVEIPLTPGENVLQLTAYNSKGAFTSQTITLLRNEDISRTWFVFVAIEKYEHDSFGLMSDNEYASRLASYVGMSQVVKEESIVLLLNEKATLRNIRKALDQLNARAGPKDRIVIYLAGAFSRNGRSLMLIPYDGIPDYPSTLLDLNGQILLENPSQSCVMLVDANYVINDPDNRSDPIKDVLTYNLPPTTLLFRPHAGKVLEVDKYNALGKALLRGVGGEADIDRDGVLTARELWKFAGSRREMFSPWLFIVAGPLDVPIVNLNKY
ncbi:MAG: hypothetical protein H8K04_15015 [Nitrospira sp.]